MKQWWQFLFLIIITACCMFFSRSLYQLHKDKHSNNISKLIALPHQLTKTVSLEFSGITADYLLLKTMVFHGDKLINQTKFSQKDWDVTYQALNHITHLDPRFWDPYLLAEMTLPWDAGMIEETNHLLKRAALNRTDDFQPYYYLWFNHYYFLNDYKTAGPYLQKAAEKPGAPQYLPILAARMSLYSGNSLGGIVFLQEMLKKTDHPKIRTIIQNRLEVLKKIYFLEKKILEYHASFHRYPENLNDLVEEQIIDKIPRDPYGGTFYIFENNKVYTTSKMIHKKK